MNKLEKLFTFPKEEIIRLEADLTKQFGITRADFIKKEARQIASQYQDKCAHLLVNRFVEMNQVVEGLPSKPTKKQYDAFVKNILYLAEPAEIAKEMGKVIEQDEVYRAYRDFIERSDRDQFHQLYLKNAFPEATVLRLSQLAMVHMKKSIEQLHHYIDSLHAHNQLINQIQEKRQSTGILKTGASLIGLGIGIPFLGLGLGKLLGAGDKQKIQESIGNIFEHIDFLEESLYDTIAKLGDSLYLLFLTLLGGTFVTVSQVLQSENLCITGMGTDKVIQYSLTPEEKTRFENWYQFSINGISELIKEKRWHDAIESVKKMHHIITGKPIHAKHEIVPNKSALYMAHVFYYSVYQEALLEEYRLGHTDSFLTQAKAFWDTLILYPLEKDLPSFASHPAQFIFLYIKEYIDKHPNELDWLSKADEYIGKRHETNVLKGEFGENPKDYMENVKTFFIGLEFYDHVYKRKAFSKRKYREKMYSILTEETINHFIEIDNSLQHPDEFTVFLHTIKDKKMKAKRAPYIRWTLRVVIAVLFIMLITVSVKPFSPKVTTGLTDSISFINQKWGSLTSTVGSKWNSIFDEEDEIVEDFGLIRIAEDTVNIRQSPSLNGKVIATGYADETYRFLDEEQLDTAGVTWLTIQLSDGQIAYVSKKVVKVDVH